MQPMAPAAAAKLFKLKPVRRVLFVLCRHVITLFALGALQNYIISRHKSSLFHDLGHCSGTDRSAAFADSEAEAFFHSDGAEEFHF